MRFLLPSSFLVAVCVAQTDPASLDAMMEAGHWKRARQIVETRLEANPKDAQAHAWLSKIDSSFGDPEGAVAEAERAVALDSRKPQYHGQLAEACALLAEKSNVIKGLGYVRCMKREIAAALAIDPHHVDTLLVEMMYSFKAPTLAGGNKKQARAIADQIVHISPAWGYLAHARLLQDQGDDATTEDMLRKAVAAAPGFYRARISLAEFYCCTAHRKRFEDAERVAREAIALDPQAEAAYDMLARVYVSTRRWADLDELLNRAERAVPDDLEVYYSAARVLIEIGQDFPRAEHYLQHYLGQAPEGREATFAQARYQLGTLYGREGRRSDAVRELRAAVRLAPDFEPAKKELARLL